MSKQIRLGKSPLTDTIYAGNLNKKGNMWLGEKHDVTDDFHNVMGKIVPLNGGFKIEDEKGDKFIFSQFPATFEGIEKAIEFYNKRLYELTVLNLAP